MYTDCFWLFKGCLILSTELITIRWEGFTKTNYFIYWMAIYLLKSVIHALNNRALWHCNIRDVHDDSESHRFSYLPINALNDGLT